MLNKGLFTSNSDLWETPQEFFDKLNKEFNFTLDPCATVETAKCKKFYTRGDNGLIQDWGGNVVFVNPPYGRVLRDWVEKCSNESKKKNIIVVMLIPARPDTRYFHKYIYHKAEIRFIKGRLKFNDGKGSAPFPSMLVIFRGNKLC